MPNRKSLSAPHSTYWPSARVIDKQTTPHQCDKSMGRSVHHNNPMPVKILKTKLTFAIFEQSVVQAPPLQSDHQKAPDLFKANRIKKFQLLKLEFENPLNINKRMQTDYYKQVGTSVFTNVYNCTSTGSTIIQLYACIHLRTELRI